MSPFMTVYFNDFSLTCQTTLISIENLKEKSLRLGLVSPHVRYSQTVLDSGFHVVDSGYQVLEIPDSTVADSGFQNTKDSRF